MRYFIVFTLCLAAAVAAETVEDVRIEIKIDAGDGSFLSLDSKSMGFDMRDLQVGENRSFTDDEGRTVFMTRTDKGFTVDVDGKSFQLPELMPEHRFARHVAPPHGLSHDVETTIDITSEPDGDVITIMSSDDIDVSTQDAVRAALQSGGYGKQVRFVRGGATHVERRVRVSTSEKEQP
jgi:hypothetical protein